MITLEGKATAYVCENYTCQLPTAEAKTLLQLLGGQNGSTKQVEE
jgi:uncharacterized protein YyaL (SSP411 family)